MRILILIYHGILDYTLTAYDAIRPLGALCLKRSLADADLLFELFVTQPKVVIVIHLYTFFGRLLVGWRRNKDFIPDKLILRPSRGHCDAIFVSGLESFHGPDYFVYISADFLRIIDYQTNDFWDR